MQVNDQVTWTSQSHASWKAKEGTIVAVIPAGQDPKPFIEQFADHNREAVKKPGGPRREDSYLVSIPSRTGRGRAKLYWPVAKSLQLKTTIQEAAL